METKQQRIRVSDSWQEEANDDLAKTLKAVKKKYDSLTFPTAAIPAQHVTARQLTAQLECCYAYMHGGRDLSQCPIICLPHYPPLCDVSNADFNRVILYLTTIVSACIADVGFVLLVDRRKERWPALRGTLTRIAGFFPGYLKTILVLRPSGFIQGTMSDIGFRWSREEIAMKVPVTMLSSLDELYNYIHPSQLTAEFGGSFEYDHESWIKDRGVLEDFATGASKLCDSLVSYGSELTETELPNDLKSAEELLRVQEIKTDTFKTSIEGILKEAVAVRLSLTSSSGGSIIADKADNDDDFIKTSQNETIINFLTLIEETDLAFERFWQKHIKKLKQCFHLRRFEQSYREARADLAELMSWFDDQPHHFGGSVQWIEATLRDLEHKRNEVEALFVRISSVVASGEELLEQDNYAVDSIGPKKDELVNVSSRLREGIEKRERSLRQTLQFLVERTKWCNWCERGMKLLAGQQIEKTTTVEGADLALKELHQFFSNDSVAAPFSGKTRHQIKEEYEAAWCSELENLFENLRRRHEDVVELSEKRKSSLKKITTKHGDRPVQLVEPSKKSGGKPRDDISSASNQNSKQNEEKAAKRKSLTISNQTPVAPVSPATNHEANSVKRRHVMNELLHTEKVYVSELRSIVEGYGKAIEQPENPDDVPKELRGKSEVLLGNMADILRFHEDEFLVDLITYSETPSKIGKCFISKSHKFRVYCQYCQNSIKSEQLRTMIGEQHPFFLQCQKRLGHRLSLGAYLLKPIQRLTKYQLLLQQMLKHSTHDQEELKEAIKAMLEILKSVNDGMHQIAIVGYQGDLGTLGKLLMQGPFSIQVDHKKAGVKALPRPRFSKLMQRHLFLYEKAFLLCKQQAAESVDGEASCNHNASNTSNSGAGKAQVYLYKHSLKMGALGITENLKNDPRKFEVWYHGREEVYTLSAPTVAVKQEWVKAIKSALASQPKSETKPPDPRNAEGSEKSRAKVKRSQSAKKGKQQQQAEAKTDFTNAPKIKSSSTSSTRETLKKKASSLTRSASLGKGKDKKFRKKSCDASAKFELIVNSASSDTDRISPGPESTKIDVSQPSSRNKTPSPTESKLVVLKERPIIAQDELFLRVGDVVQYVEEGKEGWVRVRRKDSEGWAPTTHLASVSDASSYDSFSSNDFLP